VPATIAGQAVRVVVTQPVTTSRTAVAPPGAVARPRLVRRIDAAGPGGVALVVAPAGYGKSVLLAQWASSHSELTICSLALGQDHDDAVVFANDLLGALEPVLADGEGLREHLQSGGGGLGAPFVRRLLAALGELERPAAIVLDDLHALSNEALLAEVDQLLRDLPPPVRAVVGSRSDPPFDVLDLHLRNKAVELRAADLAFDVAEAGELVSAVAGHEVGGQPLTSLVERTDGWAVGLQLAALSLDPRRDLDTAVAEFAGDDRLVVEYLTREVLDLLEPDVRHFVLATSVLPWLTAELCEAVLGEGGAQAMLEHLVARGLFLTPLDRRGRRYRYHHLFAELLCWHLRLHDGQLEARLRRSAAEWFRANGHMAEAVEQLLALGDTSDAFDLAVAEGPRRFERGESATLVRWLSEIAASERAREVEVGLNLLAAQCGGHDYAAAAETYRRLPRASARAGDLVAADALYASLVLHDLPADQVLAVTEPAMVLLEQIDHDAVADFLGVGGAESVQVILAFTDAVARMLRGDVGEAATLLERVMGLPGARYPAWRINALATLGLARAWTGHLVAAEQSARAALELAGAVGLSSHQSVAHAHLAMALVALERLEVDRATVPLDEAGRQAHRTGRRLLIDFEQHLLTRLDGLRGERAAALARVRSPSACTVEPELLARARRRIGAHLLLQEGEIARVRTIWSAGGRRPGPTQVDLELASPDRRAARRAVELWVPDARSPTEVVEHLLRAALVAEGEGDDTSARRRLGEAVGLAEEQSLRRPFVDAPGALHLLRSTRHGTSQTFVDETLAAARDASARRPANAALMEPLTDRELVVMAYLPTRMSNSEIAGELFVSINTVKTHLRNIYRKLDCADRDAAVVRASELGLL
jgi:LuxR family maltose regulon positive regulatory protein